MRRGIRGPERAGRRRAAGVVFVLLAAGGVMADPAARADTGGEVVVDRAFVPSEKRPQGEVRLVRRGDHVVVQTILYTRVLKRVLANITAKERQNWPSGTDGHDDMERYVAALEEHRKKATGAGAAPDDAGADRRRTMIIEFVDAGKSPFVTLGGVGLEGSGSAVRVATRETPVVLDLSAAYVRRNMRLIVADAFQVTVEEAGSRIAASRLVAAPPGE